tara:strand:+ start:249 stop:620 length:372 start_codon:yes stop_codon:yes gene_type:complete
MTNKSLDNLLEITNSLAAEGKQVSVKVLRPRKMRQGEGLSRDQQHGKGAAKGNLGGLDSISGAGQAVGSGFHCRPINSMGGSMVRNLGQVQSNYEKQIRADRKAAAQDRIAEKIDSLLEDIRG